MRPVTAVSLRKLFPTASFVGCVDWRVTEAYDRSSEVQPGALFAALPGTLEHGADHLPQAIIQGARCLLVDRAIAHCALPQCIVRDVRTAFGQLSHALYRNPTHELRLAGVTGTNGKTTTTYMIRSILTGAGHPTGLSGTIEVDHGTQTVPARLTTPGARELAHWATELQHAGRRHAAMEVSSHALAQCRLAGTQLDTAVITNLTQDHLDYHGDMAEYHRAKSRIFDHLKPTGVAVLNADDPGAMSFQNAARHASHLITFGLRQPAMLQGLIRDTNREGSTFEVHDRETGQCTSLRTPLIGPHNVSNALAAIAACRSIGIELAAMVPGLAALSHVPGRMQRIDTGEPFAVWVDYAHTDDGLRRAIAAVRPLITGQLTLVFGAGGDRDPSKRPRMGLAAAAADRVIITSDNPRSECPAAIARDILDGWPPDQPSPTMILDRKEAIFAAISAAQPGDGVLVAGKGHETFQQIGTEKRLFCDCQTCYQAIEQRHATGNIPAPHTLPQWITALSSERERHSVS